MNDRILLIEDDPFLAEIYVAKFEEAGFSISVARDGCEGLKKAKEQKPSLLLIDIVMPKLDGFEVLEAMKRDPEIKDVSTVIFSNLGEEEDVKRALELGARDYLVKAHYTPTEVVARVSAILNGK